MESAYNRGARVVLTGSYGDHLYTGRDEWLLDLILERQYGPVLKTLWRRAIAQGLPQLARSRDVRLVGRRALERLSLRPRPENNRVGQRLTPVWLTKEAEAMLADDSLQGLKADRARRPDQFDHLFSPANAWGRSNSIFYANRIGVEVRHPYRDRRLMEFIASIPAHQLYRDGYNKHVLRKAMSGLLPEGISNRTEPSSLTPLFARGLADREKRTAQTILHHPNTTWHDYVQREWLEDVAIVETNRGVDGSFPLIHWLCISFELWRSASKQASPLVNVHKDMKENLHGTKESSYA
jgi:asparagine synthetase B (glutamine-hydrolysing)